MAPRPTSAAAATLSLGGDGDDIELVRAIEATFGIRFGESDLLACQTAGQLYEAVVQRVVTSDAPGKCASSMAFYRIRAALRRLTGATTITPETRVRDLGRISQQRLEREAGGTFGARRLSWIGGVYLLVALAGLILPWFPGLLPTLALVPVGVLLARLDPGSLGHSTVGDLACSFARHNFATLQRAGADARPEAVWATVRSVLAEHGELNAADIDRETRFYG